MYFFKCDFKVHLKQLYSWISYKCFHQSSINEICLFSEEKLDSMLKDETVV